MKENSLVWLRLNWELKSTVNIGLFNSQAKRMLQHIVGVGERRQLKAQNSVHKLIQRFEIKLFHK